MEVEYQLTSGIKRNLQASEIAVGAVFEGKIGPTEGIFIKIYGQVVSMDNPLWSWNADVKIEGFRRVKAKLVVEKYL